MALTKSHAAVYGLPYDATICDPIVASWIKTKTCSMTDAMQKFIESSVKITLDRGDMVYIKCPHDKDINYLRWLWDGKTFVSCVYNGRHERIPDEFKVVTEFPVDYWWTPGGDINDNWTIRDNVNFDHAPFVEEIATNIEVADEGLPTAVSTFKHNDKVWRIVFDYTAIPAVLDLPEEHRTMKAVFDEKISRFKPYWTVKPSPIPSSKEMYELCGPTTLYCQFIRRY